MKKIVLVLILFINFTGCSSEQSEKNIYALLVSEGDKLVKEEYFNGKQKTDLLNVQSVTKSIVSLLIGLAIDKGFIKNEETFLYEYFPDEPYFDTEQKKSITIKHLLNHTSGIEWNGYLEHAAFLKSSEPFKYVLQKEMVDHPGEVYNYNSGGTHLLSLIISKSTGMSTLEFADENLFQPLGCAPVRWEKLNDGYYDGAGFGLSMQAQDLLKIGQLLLDKGKWNTTPLIPAHWISKTYDEGLKKGTKWGLRQSKHGYGWYSKTKGDKQILYAMGYGGQFIFIIPSEDMVIVSTHNHDTPDGIAQQVDFIKETFPPLLKE